MKRDLFRYINRIRSTAQQQMRSIDFQFQIISEMIEHCVGCPSAELFFSRRSFRRLSEAERLIDRMLVFALGLPRLCLPMLGVALCALPNVGMLSEIRSIVLNVVRLKADDDVCEWHGIVLHIELGISCSRVWTVDARPKRQCVATRVRNVILMSM